MTQIYWQVFKNLEREFQELANTVFINDKQQEVYSMKIADLLIRTAIEIEALSKELYLMNGGDSELADEEMYFDTVCIKHLNDKWKLNDKVVLVVSPDIYFEEESSKVLTPLHNAHKRGKCDWKKAYQDVKHNRVRKLERGNIKHLLRALAALYVFNLYYKDTHYDGLKEQAKTDVNLNFGSDLFSVKIHKVNGLSSDGAYQKHPDYDECIYIEDYDSKTKERALASLQALNDYINKRTEEEIVRQTMERMARGEEVTEDWIRQIRIDSAITKNILPIKDYKLGKSIHDGLGGLLYNIILNKQQYA